MVILLSILKSDLILGIIVRTKCLYSVSERGQLFQFHENNNK